MTNRPEPLPRGVTDAEGRIVVALGRIDAREAVDQLDLLVDMLRDDLHEGGDQIVAIARLERVAAAIQGSLDKKGP